MDKPIFFTEDMPSATATRMVQRGEAVRLAPGVFTTDVTTPPEMVVACHWMEIAGHEFPDAVVSDRSGFVSQPVDGVLYLVHDRRNRDLDLPGLRVSARTGAAPQHDDTPLPGGLHLASTARAMVENTIPARARKGFSPRRLTRHELGEQVERAIRFDGLDKLNRNRDRARQLADITGARANFEKLNDLVGAAMGTREAQDLPPVLHARAYRQPYDPDRIARYDLLVRALREAPPQSRRAPAPEPNLPFFEAYFSNFIEGTEFTVEEASGIVFDGRVPEDRSEDAHDITGTYKIVVDETEMRRTADDAQEFMDLLRERHATVMAGRPDKHPGEFKTKGNQAGATLFVDPTLVEGTLAEGFARLADLDTAWERSVYAMFLVVEVHSFDDGNGRLARIMMNAELVAGNQHRILVPTVFRTDYLGALRRLSRDDDPTVLIKALRYAHDWSSRIDFNDFDTAVEQMTATNAFETPADGVRLLLPAASMFEEPTEIAIEPEPRQRTGLVRPYRRQDGTPVQAHRRAPPKQ